MQISYGTVGFRDRDLETALRGVAAAGYTHMEMSSLEPHLYRILEGAELASLHQLIRDCGLSVGTVHAPLGRAVIAAPEERWRVENVGLFSDYLRLSGDLGAGGMVIHPVPNPSDLDGPGSPELTRIIGDAARRSLDELVPVALASSVRMLLENLPFAGPFPLLTMTELSHLVEPYPEEAVGLVIDTGHAWTIGNDPAAEIRAAGDRLWGTHLQDVDGENPRDNHWAPTQGDLDWPAIREALLDVGYRGLWTFEIIYPRHDESDQQLAQMTYDTARELGLHS